MSIAGSADSAASARPAASAPPWPWSPWAAVVLGCALVLALTAGKALSVWRTGVFLDPDDAMRAVEVRDLLAGQGWFDMVQHRMAPGHGVPMHWSRLADLPIAAAEILVRGPVGQETAECLVRLAQPVALLAVFLAALARIAHALIGPRGPLAACLLAGCGLETVGVYIPGHIHHHALQVTLLAVLAALVADGVAEPRRRGRKFAWAGGVAAVSLAINLQNVPFLAVVVAALGLAWVLRGGAFDRALRRFALALVAGCSAVFLLQVPPDRYLVATADAFGAPHLAAAWLGGAALAALSFASPRLAGPVRRAAAALLLAGAVLVALRTCCPACLGDPYAAVDPLLRSRWLAEVGEAMPLAELMRRDPAGTLPIAAALSIGLALLAAAALLSRGAAQARWLVLGGFVLAGVAGSLWEVRVAASAEPFAALGGAWALCRLFDPSRPRRPLAAPLCVVCGLAVTQAGWAAAMPAVAWFGRPAAGTAPRSPAVDAESCFLPSAYAGLAALPPGLVLSTIDPGSQILAYTAHAVLAAPYHRNSYGDLLSLEAFDAEPGAARALAVREGVRYVALCLTSPEAVEAAGRAPDGLAAALLAGHPPPWLADVGAGRGPVRVYRVADPGPPVSSAP